jgi:uncharacterized membrane protein YjjP (DUF1212 family)
LSIWPNARSEGAVSLEEEHDELAAEETVRATRHRRWWDEWPLLVVLATAAAGLAVVASDHFKRGTVLFGAALVLGMILRFVLPDSRIGLLKVRSRTIDVLTLGFFAFATVTLAVVVPPPTG